MERFDRVKGLIGESSLKKLQSSSVILFGVGGVGGFVAEALVRSGIGRLCVVDGDKVSITNLNRQIIATENSIGKFKVDVVKERLYSINPKLKIETFNLFYLPENAHQIDLSSFDYVIDAVDTVSAKLEIICRAKSAGVPVISCMGTGGKLMIEKLAVADIKDTKGCPLARVMRRELSKKGISGVKVVYSEESVCGELIRDEKGSKKSAPSSMIFVPAAAGLYIAREVVNHLTNTERE